MSDKPQDLLQKTVNHIAESLNWMQVMMDDSMTRDALAADLGLEPGQLKPLSLPPSEMASIEKYREASTRGEGLDKQATLDVLQQILSVIDSIVATVESIVEADESSKGEEAARQVAYGMLNLLLLGYFRLRYPALYKVGQLLGFVEEISSTNLSEKVYFDRIPEVIGGAGDYFSRLYKLETESDARNLSNTIFPALAFILAKKGNKQKDDGEKTFVSELLETKNIIYGWDSSPGSTSPVADAISGRAFSIALEQRATDGSKKAEAAVNLTLLFVPREHGGPGVFLSLGGAGEFEGKISDSWRLRFQSRAKGSLDLLIGKNMDAGGSADVGASLTIGPEPDAPGQNYVLPNERGTRLEFGKLSFSGELSASSKAIEVVAEGGAVVISGEDCDGFISEVMTPTDPSKETRIAFNIGAGISSERGFYLTGGTGLEALIPIGKSVGPVTFQQILIRLAPATDPKPGNLTAEVGASLSVKLGPITATVDQIGLRTRVPFGKNEAGKWDFDIGFKTPTGVGLKIQSPALTGGGFLFFDSERSQYGGIVDLTLSKSGIVLKAIGLIATRFPSGAKGFSLLVIVTAEGFKPIPLGLGFNLTGIGGLLAVNRTFNEEAVREGIRNHALEMVLFPKDPVAKAPLVISAISTFFPASKGSFLFGVLVQISWGPQSPLKMNLALILETGQRLRLIILGRVAAILPNEKSALIRLNMDAIGVIDFDQGTAALDAVLYDSRLLTFPLTGSMAMRLRWSSSPMFALSVGGFHPGFKPPANFPAVDRLSVSLSNSDSLRLRSECYFAITSNTLQFGSKMELFAKAIGFSVEGRVGYDVLIQFDPFFFIADFYASFQLKRGSRNLFKVKLEGQLSGPRPLHVKARATFEIFWCDFSFGIDKTLISGQKPPKLEPVNVTSQLIAALDDPRNWSGEPPENERRLVALRETPAPGMIIVHPLSTLSVKQTVVPLDLEISKFGQTTPSGPRLFRIESLSVNGKGADFTRVNDLFAPSQFLDLSDEEKLTAPSFEPMTAGVTVGFAGFLHSGNDADLLDDEAIHYETIIVDKEHKEKTAAPPVPITAALLTRYISLGAAARSEVGRTGMERFRAAADRNLEGRNVQARKGWAVASAADGSEQAAPGIEAGKVVSYSQSFQALQKLTREDPAKAKTLMLVRVTVTGDSK